MKPLGVIFDLDGTLVLSHHDFGRMRAAIVRTALAYGGRPGRLVVGEQSGTSQTLRAAQGELRAAGVSSEVLARFAAEVDQRIEAIEMEAVGRTVARKGARELLGALKVPGRRLGVFTRSSETFCRAALGHTGLLDFFTYFRTRSSPGPAKPSPESLRLLLRSMELPSERALFVGDHLEDAQCAAGAGIRFLGLLPDPKNPNRTTAEQFLAEGASSVAADLVGIGRLIGITNPSAAAAGPRRRLTGFGGSAARPPRPGQGEKRGRKPS